MDASEPVRLTVEGEEFEVRRNPTNPMQHDFVWLSGPNPGYGFSSTLGLALGPSRAAVEPHLLSSIREFLAAVDPVTGYIE